MATDKVEALEIKVKELLEVHKWDVTEMKRLKEVHMCTYVILIRVLTFGLKRLYFGATLAQSDGSCHASHG